MLQKENRLAKVRDFNLIIKHGSWINGHLLDIKALDLAKMSDYFPTKEDPEMFIRQLKVAVVAGLKVDKSAVKRNRIKRQMREAVRLLIKDRKIKEGYYLMVVAKKIALEHDYAEISKEIDLLMRRAKLLNS